jgi:hypothetical protein
MMTVNWSVCSEALKGSSRVLVDPQSKKSREQVAPKAACFVFSGCSRGFLTSFDDLTDMSEIGKGWV